MPLWILGLGGWLKGAAGAAFGWIRANPWPAVVIGLSLALAWTWHGRSVARSELAQHIAAEKSATGAQKRVNAAATVYYKDAANVADTHHDEMVADAFDATARYVQSHRVQADRTCKAPAAPASSDPGVPPPVPSGVVVGEADVHACADLYAYSASAHDWAQSLKLPEEITVAAGGVKP